MGADENVLCHRKANSLGWCVGIVTVDAGDDIERHELTKDDCDNIDEEQDNASPYGQPMLVERVPHELPLGGCIDFFG